MGLVSVLKTVKSRIGAMWAALERDFFFFGGMALLGYGLYLLQPWLGLSTVGLLLMLTGFLMREKK